MLIEEGQARSVGCTAAHGDGDAGQEEYSVQTDQGHQGPHRDREVSSTRYYPHTPTLHYPLYSITSLPCPPPLLDPLVLHSNSTSSTLFPIFLAIHPLTLMHSTLSMQSLLPLASYHFSPLLPLLPTPPTQPHSSHSSPLLTLNPTPPTPHHSSHSSPLCLCRKLQEPDAEKQVQSQVTALQQDLQSAMMAGMVATSLHTLNTLICTSCCMCTVCHNIML